MQASNKGVQRYNLPIPIEMYEDVTKYAEKHHTTVVEVLRRFIKLGLIAAALEDDPDKALIIKSGNTERQIILL